MMGWARLLMMAAATIATPAAAQTPVGDWAGTLEANGAKLRIVLHVRQEDDGALTGTLDSPDQNAHGIPVVDIQSGQSALSFTVPAVSGRYDGHWDVNAQQWRGEWRQGGAPLPLNFSAGLPPPAYPTDWVLPDDAQITALIDARIAPRAGAGVAMGIISADGPRVVARGPQTGAPFDENSLFEIGSITKVFTALILADMAAKGEVSLDDPASRYLPEGATMPQRGERQITLRDLAQHRSGLPRLPDNMPMADPADPYADYTEAMMLAFLASYRLPRDAGAEFEYSNFGAGLLGYLLGRAAGSDYQTLLRERITGPLGMADTVVTLPARQSARFVAGYDQFMQPAKPWNLAGLVGAGGVRSSTADMLKFAAAVLDPASPIAPAMRIVLGERAGTGDPRIEQALGWQVFHPAPGRDILMHDGGTGGFRSTIAVEPASDRAVIALSNSAAEPSTSDLALHVLAGSPVADTPAIRTAVDMPPGQLDRVVGRYRLGPDFELTVERQGEGLIAALTGQQSLPIFAEGPLRFFTRAVDAQLHFTTDSDGVVDGVVLHQHGRELRGEKLPAAGD